MHRQVPKSLTDLKATLPTLPDASHCFYGVQTISLSDAWQPLASLSAADEMLSYHLSNGADVEIQYSKRDNLYYIHRRPGAPELEDSVTIDFIVRVPPKSQEELPQDVQDKILECLNFKAAPLQVEPGATGAEYLAALKTQEVGACRHRCAVFKNWMDEEQSFTTNPHHL